MTEGPPPRRKRNWLTTALGGLVVFGVEAAAVVALAVLAIVVAFVVLQLV